MKWVRGIGLMGLSGAALALSGCGQVGTAPAAKVKKVALPKGECRVVVNGKTMSVSDFATETKTWTPSQPEIHLTADPAAGFECVDAVLTAIKAADLRKLGFVGNEMHVRNSQ